MNLRDIRVAWFVTLSALSLPSTDVAANSISTPVPVTYLRSFGSAFGFALAATSTGCADAANVFYVDHSYSGSKQMYALLLGAYQAGDLVAVVNYVCDTGGRATALDVDMRKP